MLRSQVARVQVRSGLTGMRKVKGGEHEIKRAKLVYNNDVSYYF
jgi:hypothetical protein